MPSDGDNGLDGPPPGNDPDRTVTRLDGVPDGWAASAEHTGQKINQYTLTRLLGEGGFGTVWLAEQHEPVRRQVALKIIKLGMDTRQVIARFEAERQALAVMDHPNIAKVFDAGSTETGRPYFVMEYTEGLPFTQYCDKHSLSVRDRLELFQKICHAVQHAHLKGIIHRDIKPSNVLVTTVDGKPQPKVIDFGIAKATEARLTEHSMFTQQGQVIGTPAYMSPEQAGQTDEDIDTRSDVYSLGVLLYEAMTGETPFNSKTLLSAGMAEIRRIICEVDPPKPSTRLSTTGEALTTIAEQRSIEPRRLSSLLTGDIDVIIMKAIEKNRSRRYQTPTGFAEDIERYLKNESVLAAPPSRRYRVRKFARRNRRAVIACALILVTLLAGTTGTTIGFVKATRAEGIAVRAANDAELARQLEAEQRGLADKRTEEAQTERDKAKQVTVFLTDMLAGVGAQVAQGADTTLLRGILNKTSERVGQELAGQPEVEAEVRSHLGVTYLQLRDFEASEENLLRSLELYQSINPDDDPNVAQSLGNIGLLRETQGRPDEGVALHRESLAMWQQLDPKDGTDVPLAMMSLANALVRRSKYEEAEQLLLQALEDLQRKAGEEHEDVGVAYNSLANLKQHLEEYESAENYYRRALATHRAALGDDHPFVATDLHNLGFLLAGLGRNKEAIELHEQSLARSRVLYPDGHEEIASNLIQLGVLYRYDDERMAEAPAMLEEAIALQTKLYGELSEDVARTNNDLGKVLSAQQRYEEAVEKHQRAATIFAELHGEQHNDVAVSLQALARALAWLERFDEANVQYDRVLEIQTSLYGEAHIEPAITLVNIGAMHRQAENFDAAEIAILQSLEVFEAAGYGRTPYAASAYENLGRIYREGDRLTESAEALRLALDVRREAEGPNARTTLGASYALSGTLIEIEAFEEAEELLLKVLDDPEGAINARIRTIVQRRYASLLSATERYDECTNVLEDCYATYLERGETDSAIEALGELIQASERRRENNPTPENEAETARWRALQKK